MVATQNAEYLSSMMYWLKRTYLTARKSLDQALHEFGLTGSQFELLRHVLQHDGIEQRALAQRIHISGPSVTGLVDALSERGLIRRATDAEDARVKRLYVTEAGRNLGDHVDRRAASIEARMLATFSPAEQALAKEFFARMVTNLGVEVDEAEC